MEYAVLFGLNIKSLFSSGSISGMLLLFGLAVALAVVGYLLKGVWGACIALGSGTILFMYCRGSLPF
jgi:hypothetical protein